MNQYLGIRNIVASPTDFKYLLFYEIDTTDESIAFALKGVYEKFKTSYIIYSTKNGYHAVGLTPINGLTWGSWFHLLHNRFNEYYGGQTLRISMKPEEEQKLFAMNLNYPYVLDLMGKFITRFKIKQEDIPMYGEPPPYTIVLEKYWSEKD